MNQFFAIFVPIFALVSIFFQGCTNVVPEQAEVDITVPSISILISNQALVNERGEPRRDADGNLLVPPGGEIITWDGSDDPRAHHSINMGYSPTYHVLVFARDAGGIKTIAIDLDQNNLVRNRGVRWQNAEQNEVTLDFSDQNPRLDARSFFDTVVFEDRNANMFILKVIAKDFGDQFDANSNTREIELTVRRGQAP